MENRFKLLSEAREFYEKISSYSVLQTLIHTINSESHGFSGNFLTFFKSPSLRSGDFKKRQNEPRAIYPKLPLNPCDF